MKIAEIYEILNSVAPFEMQENWDNSGLLLGEMNTQLKGKIYLSLDLDSDLIENAEENSLFITHHPLIFGGIKVINPLKFPGNLIYKMIKKNISLISVHTNFDKCVLNQFVATKILGYEIYDKKDFLIFMTGSGSELLDDLDIDCFITGDLKYHTALQSLENRISLIDINHFESERYFGLSLAPFLQKFKSQVIISNSKNPFQYI